MGQDSEDLKVMNPAACPTPVREAQWLLKEWEEMAESDEASPSFSPTEGVSGHGRSTPSTASGAISTPNVTDRGSCVVDFGVEQCIGWFLAVLG